MTARLLAPALLFALAAGEGGSAGGNTAGEESAGQPVAQQATPENLTDDPRNEAIPLDSPPPTPNRPKAP